MKNKKLLKKLIATGALLAMTALPTIAYASSYSSSLSFDTTLKGQTRYFGGSDINMDISAYTTGSGHQANSYFAATLYRSNTWSTDKVGVAYYNRNGYTSRSWTNAGSGNYYFYFEKATDGITVNADSGNVQMYN